MNTIDPLVTADETLHNELPLVVSDQVETIVISASDKPTETPAASIFLAKSLDETGFVKNVLHDPEEECWNDL